MRHGFINGSALVISALLVGCTPVPSRTVAQPSPYTAGASEGGSAVQTGTSAASAVVPAATPEALPVVYFVDAYGCAACNEIRPMVHTIAKSYEGKLKLVVVNAYSEKGEERARELLVHGYPVLVLQDRYGTIQVRLYGLLTEDRIKRGFAMITRL